MERVVPLYRYLIWETVKPALVFYGILMLILALPLLYTLLYPVPTDMQGQISGVEGASTIFLFVVALNSFKSGFIFASANSFTRRQYFLAVMGMLLTVATAMSLVDAGINGLLQAALPGVLTRWPQGYPLNSPAELELWHWAMNLLAVTVGFCVTISFYRLNRPGKWLLALSPVLLSALLQSVLPMFINPIVLDHAFSQTFDMLMGLGDTPSALIGALSMAVATIVLMALGHLLIRGAPIKEQER